MTAESLPPIAIRASGLEVRYGDKVAVSGVDLEVAKGSLLSATCGSACSNKGASLSILQGGDSGARSQLL